MTSVPDPAAPRQEAPMPRPFAAELYAATFSGRHDAYSVWVPGAPGEGHWQAVRKPLTGKTVLQAFETGIPISGYVLNPDSQTHVAALDIDLENGYELAGKFLRHLASLGGFGYIEASRRGAHVWMILDRVLPAITIRLGLKALVSEAGLPEDPKNPGHHDPKIELRPAQDRLGTAREGEEEPLGNCLRMPTMPHPLTGKRYVLISSDGEKLSGKLTEMMPVIDLCPATVFEDAAERAPKTDVPIAPPRHLSNPYGDSPKGAYSESMTEILRDLWGVPNVPVPGRGMQCPHPNHPDRSKSAQLHRSDERVLCYSPECWINNNGSGRGTIEMTREAPRRG